MHPESQPYLTINTHQSLFRVERLAFSIASAPAQFQIIMDNLLAGLNGVSYNFDDILITGKTAMHELKKLEKALKKLSDKGIQIQVKEEKCELF